jgi:predicted XRE-type DNA-binding protein
MRLHHARKQGLRQAAIGMVKAGLSQAQIKTALGVSQAELDAWTTDEDD